MIINLVGILVVIYMVVLFMVYNIAGCIIDKYDLDVVEPEGINDILVLSVKIIRNYGLFKVYEMI